jgi:hypothetical protein
MQSRLTITHADKIGELQISLLIAGQLVEQCPWTLTLIGKYFHLDLYIGLEHFSIEPVPETSDFKASPCPGKGQSNPSYKRKLALVS